MASASNASCAAFSSRRALSSLASTGGQIQADPSTNALIITASQTQYRQLRAVIDLLDQRRVQVMVESLIVEVDSAKESQFGVQWQNLLGSTGAANVGVLGTNFATNNLLALSTRPTNASISQGLNVGAAQKIDGRFVMTALANFLQTNGGSNILSRPSLLPLDPEAAQLVVGQNVPFITGSFSNTGVATAAVNPFQTIERRDVGLTLRVKPQISESGTVKLQIYQEVSSVQASSVNAPSGLMARSGRAGFRRRDLPQCAIRSGTGQERSMSCVTPPSTISRRSEWTPTRCRLRISFATSSRSPRSGSATA